MGIQERAQLAFDSGEVTKKSCSSKDDVLYLIENGFYDILHIIGVVPCFFTVCGNDCFEIGMFEIGPMLHHYAVRFNDRELGDQVRDLCLRGFGLR